MLPDDVPNAAGRNQLVSELVTKFGYVGAALAAIVSAGKSRRQIALDLIERQRAARAT